jgi:hypothetical protein
MRRNQNIPDPWPAEIPTPREQPKHDGWHWWADQFARILSPSAAADKAIVEVGTWTGRTAMLLAQMYPSSHVYAIDTFEGGPEHQPGKPFADATDCLFDRFCERCWPLRDRITPIVGTSWDGMAALADAGVAPALVYVDADHREPAVRRDILAARSLFTDAILCGDDYSERLQNGVYRAVNALADKVSAGMHNDGDFWWYENWSD